MEYLLELLKPEELSEIIEENEEIKSLTQEEIKEIISFLESLKINVKEIIQENPYVLTRDKKDLEELINTLRNYKIENIHYMIESYPNILNKSSYEIISWVEKRKKFMEEEEIIDYLENNPIGIEEDL
ncbi:MAG: hypothetical protein IKE70_04670 [Bacilli bacterium]|nr:hypothetical protein [Bacilli bacterium]